MSDDARGLKRTRHAQCTIQKRKAPKAHAGKDDFIYINRHTALHPLVKKVRKLLITQARSRVTLCGMGAAVASTCELALRCQDMLGGEKVCRLEISTGTVDLVDEVVPTDHDADEALQRRRNSKIEIALLPRAR
ncbi:hypothetical protein PYCC9005_001859 [Savitreella phatthalungensis]